MGEVLFEEVVPGGATWSHVLKRGTALRITDPEGGANAGAILFNAANFAERYNMPDTLKAQHIARLTAGFVLYSDMVAGRLWPLSLTRRLFDKGVLIAGYSLGDWSVRLFLHMFRAPLRLKGFSVPPKRWWWLVRPDSEIRIGFANSEFETLVAPLDALVAKWPGVPV